MWQVIFSSEFERWFGALEREAQLNVARALALLQERGPQLSRPYADVIHGSKLTNLKELRIQHEGNPYRAFFVFDPQRQAIVLCAGNKKGNEKRFYKEMIPLAESIYDAYLKGIE
jgi:hypothetical protein